MERIRSAENQIIKRLKRLDKKKVRTLESLFFIEGFKMVDQALKSDFVVKDIYVSENFYQNHTEYVEILEKQSLPVYVLFDKMFQSIAQTKTPQGIMAEVKMHSWDVDEIFLSKKPLLLLDGVSDPGNVGTMIRTAEAFGFGGVFSFEETADIYNPKTIRSTMGSVFRMPFIKSDEKIFRNLKTQGYQIIGSSLKGKPIEKNIFQKGKFVLVVGSESKGISKAILQHCDHVITIPMNEQVESLNASIAAGIMMHYGYSSKEKDVL